MNVRGKLFLSFFLYISFIFLFLTILLSLLSKSFNFPGIKKTSLYLYLLSLLSLIFYTVLRWFLSSHPPVQGGFENSLLCVIFIILIYGFFLMRYPFLKDYIYLISGCSFIILAWGTFTGRTSLEPLEPPFKSNWLWFHVGFAWLAFGSFLLSAIVGTVMLVRKKISEEEIKTLDSAISSSVFFGFINQGFMILTGSLWAFNLWGSYWNWDPVEVWSLICWLIYGVFLHLKYLKGWKGRRLAWISILAFICMIITFFGLNTLTEFHTYIL